jgi:dolichyl-diphosphooligosaccharide--protein glycosyltransferase
VKTYERVPGATITGTADVSEATNVTANVTLKSQTTNRTFDYTQTVQTDAQGNFELTVPYATDDTLGPEQGGTDATVEATGEYTITVEGTNQTGTVSVSESAIMSEDSEPITVELTTDSADGDDTSSESENRAGDLQSAVSIDSDTLFARAA